MIYYIGTFISGVIIGVIIGYTYDYYRNMKEFQKRQERYRRMI